MGKDLVEIRTTMAVPVRLCILAKAKTSGDGWSSPKVEHYHPIEIKFDVEDIESYVRRNFDACFDDLKIEIDWAGEEREDV